MKILIILILLFILMVFLTTKLLLPYYRKKKRIKKRKMYNSLIHILECCDKATTKSEQIKLIALITQKMNRTNICSTEFLTVLFSCYRFDKIGDDIDREELYKSLQSLKCRKMNNQWIEDLLSITVGYLCVLHNKNRRI